MLQQAHTIPGCRAATAEAAIVCAGLTKDYGGGHGVFDLDLRVQRGETFGFIGSNGAGKTTTIRLLMDLIRPDGGSATVLGMDARCRGMGVPTARLRRGAVGATAAVAAAPSPRAAAGAAHRVGRDAAARADRAAGLGRCGRGDTGPHGLAGADRGRHVGRVPARPDHDRA